MFLIGLQASQLPTIKIVGLRSAGPNGSSNLIARVLRPQIERGSSCLALGSSVPSVAGRLTDGLFYERTPPWPIEEQRCWRFFALIEVIIHIESSYLIMSPAFLPRLKSWASALEITVNACTTVDAATFVSIHCRNVTWLHDGKKRGSSGSLTQGVRE